MYSTQQLFGENNMLTLRNQVVPHNGDAGQCYATPDFQHQVLLNWPFFRLSNAILTPVAQPALVSPIVAAVGDTAGQVEDLALLPSSMERVTLKISRVEQAVFQLVLD
jgi:hypothetical protein